jgi:hypothetical protein
MEEEAVPMMTSSDVIPFSLAETVTVSSFLLYSKNVRDLVQSRTRIRKILPVTHTSPKSDACIAVLLNYQAASYPVLSSIVASTGKPEKKDERPGLGSFNGARGPARAGR